MQGLRQAKSGDFHLKRNARSPKWGKRLEFVNEDRIT